MIVALVRENRFGTPIHGFETRFKHSPEDFIQIGELHELLNELDIIE